MLGLEPKTKTPELAAWPSMPRWGVWVAPVIVVGSGALVLAEAESMAYGVICGVLMPVLVLANWHRLRSRGGDVQAAVDRQFWATAFVLGWFALLVAFGEGS
jgi:hypothetical protein